MPAIDTKKQIRCTPQTPCEHCGLPVGRQPVGNDPYFCCSGCKMVYETLHESGLGDTFYRLKDLGGETGQACPAPASIDPLLLSELDSEAFLNEHTKMLENGARSAELFLDGVHCAACVWLVERLPYERDGVLRARLDLPRARLEVVWNPARISLSEIARWLARVGYAPHPKRKVAGGGRTAAERRLLRRVGVCWAIAGNVMLLAFAMYAGLDLVNDPALTTGARWLSLLLAIPSILYGGSEFFSRAWASIRVSMRAHSPRHLHMDTPISLGILIGFAHSMWATITGAGEVWFDSITVLIAALLTARWLQLRSRRFAGDATERLLALIPTMVRRIEANGEVSIVAGKEVRPDDLVEVPAGEVVPVDGKVIAGISALNNAVLTGESRPVQIEPGVRVTAGATNLNAPIQVQVRAAGEDTRIGSLLAWIRDASSQRAPVVLMANKLSAYFVISVITLAAATGIFWTLKSPAEAVQHVVALLVISCPCALGMATPLAMAIAAGRAARSGIFIKSDEATQQLTRIDTVLLDKTGTITEGNLSLLEFEGDADALDLAAIVETRSLHPMGFAFAQSRVLPENATDRVDGFSSVAGQGVSGNVNGTPVAVGRPEWIADLADGLPARFEKTVHDYVKKGLSPVAVSVGGTVRAVAGFGDRIREEAPEIIDHFRNAGMEVYILSGDHETVVERVASTLDLPLRNALGSVDPEDKRAFVTSLVSEQGKVVVMVGDGVNDAAALQAADVGIAVQGGSTASLVAADVFLTRPGLDTIADLFKGARVVIRVIKRNLWISLGYNILGAGAAIAGLVTPLMAAIAMPISSLVVVLSSIFQHSFSGSSTRSVRTDR